ncbi:MAG: MFS transporter [Clostridia bacterium]|nr:MFS transporter [Clostridia bacterium]
MKINDLLHKVYGTNPADKGSLQPKEALAYGIAGFGQNFVCTIIGSFLTVFMTDALLFGSVQEGGIFGALNGATAVAILMLGVRIFDAFNDPIMGSVVDKTRTKWGKCRPYLKWMAIPIAIMTIICFLPLPAKQLYSFVIIAVIYTVWSVAYTIADVPYWGLSTCMTNDTVVRGNLLTVTRLLCTLGAGIVTVFLPVITNGITAKYKYTEDMIEQIKIDKAAEIASIVDKQGIDYDKAVNSFVNTVIKGQEMNNAETLKWIYFIAAVILVVVAVPMFFYGFKHTNERFTTDDNPPSFGHNMKLLFKNKELLLIVLSGVLGGARMVYTYTGGLYFAKYVLKDYGGEGLYSIITLLVVPGGLIASLLVPWMSKKFTKKWTYIIVHIFGGIVMAIMYFVGYESAGALIVAAIGLVLLGIPQGVNNIITYAMIGDTVDYLEWKTGERGEGICFAMQTLINKIGMAVGAFIGVISFSVSGCDAETLTIESPDTLWNMLVLSGVISMFACAVPMFFYTITEKKQAQMVAEIEARKATK